MAKEDELPGFGNFSIEHTMEMGSQELLEGLMSPDTATATPDSIQKIEEPKKETPKKPVAKTTTTEETTKAPDKTVAEMLVEEEEEEEEGVIAADPKKETPTAEDSPFKSLSKDLFELGVFSKDEEEGDVEISTPEEFLERFNHEKKKGAIDLVNQFIGQFGEDYQQAFEAIYSKGVHPKEYFETFGKIENFAEMDLTQEANQLSVVREVLKDQGFDAEDITSEVERLKNSGDLESVAAKHHKVLVKKESAKLAQLEKDSETRLQQQRQYKQQYVNNVNTVLESKLKAKEFDGIPLNPKLATELQDFLITEKYKTPSGETLTEFDKAVLDLKRPENHERKVKIGLLLKILEKDPTLSTIQNLGVTKKSNTLFSEVTRQKDKGSVKSEKPADQPVSWFK